MDGPGGVLVFAENWVLYRNEGKPEIRAPIPRRELLPENRGTLIVAWTLFHQKVYLIPSLLRYRKESSIWLKVSMVMFIRLLWITIIRMFLI